MLTCLLPSAGVQVLGLYVPALARFLLDSESLPKAPALLQTRHQHCLDKLNKVGPQYPQVGHAERGTDIGTGGGVTDGHMDVDGGGAVRGMGYT